MTDSYLNSQIALTIDGGKGLDPPLYLESLMGWAVAQGGIAARGRRITFAITDFSITGWSFSAAEGTGAASAPLIPFLPFLRFSYGGRTKIMPIRPLMSSPGVALTFESSHGVSGTGASGSVIDIALDTETGSYRSIGVAGLNVETLANPEIDTQLANPAAFALFSGADTIYISLNEIGVQAGSFMDNLFFQAWSANQASAAPTAEATGPLPATAQLRLSFGKPPWSSRAPGSQSLGGSASDTPNAYSRFGSGSTPNPLVPNSLLTHFVDLGFGIPASNYSRGYAGDPSRREIFLMNSWRPSTAIYSWQDAVGTYNGLNVNILSPLVVLLVGMGSDLSNGAIPPVRLEMYISECAATRHKRITASLLLNIQIS